MAIVVQHLDSGERYVLLSCSIGRYPHLAMKNETGRAAVCNAEGRISWHAADLLRVVEVDGQSAEHWLSRGSYR